MNRNEFLKSGAVLRIESDLWQVGWGNYTSYNQPVESEINFYVSDFFNENQKPWIVFENNTSLTTKEFQQILEKQENTQRRTLKELIQFAQLGDGGHFRLVNWKWREPDKNNFSKDFQVAQRLFRNKKATKLVPVVVEISEDVPTSENLKNILHRLLSSHENLYPYGFWSKGSGIIGITPEVLFQKKENQFSSMALAATRKTDSDKNLLKDDKQLKEHKIVTDSVTQTLTSMAKDIQVGSTEEFCIGLLTHLKTDITFSSIKKDEEIIKALHPTPALGGCPQTVALDYLKQLNQREDRKFYGAPFGISLPGHVSIYLVAIRNLQWNEKQSFIFSGCGVIEESQFEDEWLELKNKRQSVKELLGL